MTTNEPVPQTTDLNDFSAEAADFLENNGTDTAGAISAFADRMREQGIGMTEAERLGAWADFWQEQGRNYAQRADELSRNATTMGDTARASIWENAAQDMRNFANQRDTMSTEAWLDINSRSLSTALDVLGRYVAPVGDALAYAQMTDAVRTADWDTLGEVSSGALFGLGGGLLGAGLVLLFGGTMWPVIIAAGIGTYLGGEAGEAAWKRWLDDARLWTTNAIEVSVGFYDQALNWFNPPRRDPLALDLDGDGIETLAASGYSGVLFDQNGDGVKRATGWVASDDGLLALDRNGNGTIDNGTELFGNNTITADGTAESGLAALADLDTNADGLVNASDAQFANLQVWRDLNRDGISQSNELFTLNNLGISSLSTGGTLDVNTDLGNGNSIVNNGSFTWADGSKGNMADLALQEQIIYREFTDNVTITDAAAALPDVVATSPVRDLREAMSMDGTKTLEYVPLAA